MKPNDTPQWATDDTNNTDPGLPQKETGWTNEQVGDSSWMNWWMNLVYLWVVWLNGMWDVGGTYTADEGGSVVLSGDKLDSWIGLSPFTEGDVVTNGGQRYECTATGVSGTTMSGGPTGTGTGIVDASCTWDWVGVGDGRGRYYHDSVETITLDPSSFNDQGGGTPGPTGGTLLLGVGGPAIYGFKIPEGRRITLISASYSGDGVHNLGIAFVENLNNGTSNVLDSISVAAPGAGWATGGGDLTPDETLQAGRSYTLVVMPSGAGVTIGPILVEYDFPLPA